MWILIGSESLPLQEKIGENTHKWKCYLNLLNKEEIAVDKVIFKLHESFTNPLRTLHNPPFEIEERGWGEFEIQIKIFLKDISLKPVNLYHMLKLYPDEYSNTDIVRSEKFENVLIDSDKDIALKIPTELETMEKQEFIHLESMAKDLNFNTLLS